MSKVQYSYSEAFKYRQITFVEKNFPPKNFSTKKIGAEKSGENYPVEMPIILFLYGSNYSSSA